MFANDVLADEERVVDTQLGYPRGYAKLCRHAYIQMQGLITPFTEGPPQRFHPYAPLDEELAKLKELDALFPIINEEERDPSSARRHASFLWQQLDHLGNAGFDPSKFRVDAYGNVVYWNADPGSPLAWEVDHWFPHSRGGKTVLSNLRIVQWQVNQRKSTKLEFLVPWWDLQMGVSVNQFLSVFSSKNADFRQRAFSLFFLGGENEQLDDSLVVECHSWPQPFRERKRQVGLAAAALVKVQRHMDDTLKSLNSNRAVKQSHQQGGGTATPARRRWTLDEEEALKKALQKFGPGNWKEIKEFEPMLVNRSTVQIKDKYRLMRGEWDKENRDGHSDPYTTAIQREEQLKQARAEDKKQKEEDLSQLEEELRQLKDHNEKEKVILEDLEQSLAKQRKRVEKQRKWSETQSQYRLCLEKMIRDTMHQCVLYKEQARLNQAACNALLARLESQKSSCDAAEMDLMKRVKQRESLEALARPKITKRNRNERHTDVGGCIKLNVGTSTDPKLDKTQGWPQKFRSSVERDDHKDHKMRTLRRHQVPEEGSPDSDDHGQKMVTAAQGYGDLHGEADGSETDESSTPASVPIKEQESSPSIKAGSTYESKAKAPDVVIEAKDTKKSKEQDGAKKTASPTSSCNSAGMKRKAVEVNDLDVVMIRDEYGEYEGDGRGEREESVGDREKHERDSLFASAKNTADREADKLKPLEPQKTGAVKTRDDEQLNELLQEVLEMKGKVNAAMADAIEDEEDEENRVKRVGKVNLDKWLQMLLLPGKDENFDVAAQTNPHVENPLLTSQETMRECQDGRKGHAEAEDSMREGMLGDFFKKLSFKQGQEVAERLDVATEEPNLGVAKRGESVKDTRDVKAEENGQGSIRRQANPWGRAASPSFKRAASVTAIGSSSAVAPSQRKFKVPCNEQDSKAEERKVIESFSRLKLGCDDGAGPVPKLAADSSTDNSEVVFQIACETEFVEKMRAAREREQRRKRQASAGKPPQLQDLIADSSSQEPSHEQQLECSESPSAAFIASQSQTRDMLDMQRRRSMGGPVKQQNQVVFPRQQQQALMTPVMKGSQAQHHPQQTTTQHPHPHHSFQHPQQSAQRLQQRQPAERSSSTPAAATQFRHAQSTPSAQFAGAPQLHKVQTEELLKQRQSSSQAPQLLRQLTAGGHAVVGGGGAARKASMLMKSASTRGAGSGSRTTSSSGSGGGSPPARSNSNMSGGVGRRGGEGEPEVASLRRKASFFQDWDANEGLRASLSHVWKKAVKKFDLSRQ